MLLSENYTAEHILRLRKETGTDPSILERTIFAFGLLEAIGNEGSIINFVGFRVPDIFPPAFIHDL